MASPSASTLAEPSKVTVAPVLTLCSKPACAIGAVFASKATTVRFPSPVYLEADKEYAIVLLAPASDKYEMWTATMGQKTVQSATLPNSENVVVFHLSPLYL